jgi:APA family basic amino acid/polyamine antiporter
VDGVSGPDRLTRRLGLGDAVVLGLGSMLGAGVFTAFTPAARAAGSWLLAGLALAAAVAYCNATSSARLAARYPASGGTYVYGRERLGEFWGYLAGWGFVVGKTASCAAMALTVGAYAWPEHARVVAVATVAALTALSYRGVRKSALATRVVVAVVLVVLVGTAWTVLALGPAQPLRVAEGGVGPAGVLQAAGFCFFAFAGYARIATLGEEVVDPARTIPRAIPLALAAAFGVYLLVAVALLAALGPDGVAAAADPLAEAVAAVGAAWLEPVVRTGAVLAAVGSLLALVLGVSRTVLAMARDRHLPPGLGRVHPRFGVPHRAEVAVGAVVVLLVLLADLRGAIGFSSFAVLVYYAIANAAALTLDRGAGTRAVPVLGLAGCLLVAVALPATSVLPGLAVLAAGAGLYAARSRAARRATSR